MESVIRKNASGGKGEISVKYILNEEEMNGKGKMFSEVTIAPGCSLGYHEHVGNSETYYIIRGEGEYNDNGTIRTVVPGDRTFTQAVSAMGWRTTGIRIWYSWR